jgi:protein TonB
VTANRSLHWAPIAASLLLHAAALLFLVAMREPPGLEEATGASGLVVSIASHAPAGAAGAPAPDIDSVSADLGADERLVEPIAPEDAATEVAPQSAAAAAAPPIVTASAPDVVEPVVPPEPDLPTAAPSVGATVEPKPIKSQHGRGAVEPLVAAPDPVEAGSAPPPVVEATPLETVTAKVPPESRTVATEKATEALPRQQPPATGAAVDMASRAKSGREGDDDDPASAGDAGEASSETGTGDASRDAAAQAGLADYSLLLRAWLEKHKRYPRRAKLRNWQGTAMLHFTIDRAGNVLDYRIERSSGHAVLDEEVEAMVRRAEPLPPAPPEMQKERLEFRIPVQFVLN